MKNLFVSVPGLRFLLGLTLILAASPFARADVDPQLNPGQVDQLLGPIALYPDALVAIILPASTYPDDLARAQRYLNAGADPDQIDYQTWNESVKALARYPTLIQWLNENMTWTQQLGSAFLNQPDSVMESVQHLRAKARANGTLTSTPQQKLVLDGDDIEIVPAQPDVIYVPYYDPNQVYGQPAYYGGPPYVTFGAGLSMGYWLSYDLNWRTRVVVVGDRHHNWYEHRDWNHGPGGKPSYGNNWHQWKPPANRPPQGPGPGPRPDQHRPTPGVVQPRPYSGGPSSRPESEHTRSDYNGNNTHNRPAIPPTHTNENAEGPNHPPSVNNGSHPQPRPTLPPPSSGPLSPPSVNPRSEPRPDLHPDNQPPHPNNGGPMLPGTGLNSNRLPPTRPNQAQPHAAPPPPKPAAPPPAPKDNPRDDKPEPPR